MYSHEQNTLVTRMDGCECRIQIPLTHCEKMLGVVQLMWSVLCNVFDVCKSRRV